MKSLERISINHFIYNPEFSNGVTNYIKTVNEVYDFPYKEFVKPYDMSMPDFRKFTYLNLNKKAINHTTIIEAAESQSPTLLFPKDANIHIRLHCPFHLYKRIINEEPDEARFSDECRAIYKAKAVSSPSYGMLELLKDDLDITNIHVYKNPITLKKDLLKSVIEKDIDVIFFSRFNNLKGIEFIEPLIKNLPNDLSIFIVGKQEKKITLSKEYSNVSFLEHIEGNEKFNFLSRAKVAISLSKFENCSMAILESLSTYTPVVCWDVGGNSEIAPPEIIRVVPYGDISTFAKEIIEFINQPVNPSCFETACNILRKDFLKGLRHVERFITGLEKKIYRGITFKSEHDKRDYIPYEIYEQDISLPITPVKVLIAASTVHAIKFYFNLYNDSNIIPVFIYSGRYGSEVSQFCEHILPQNLAQDDILKIISKENPELIIFDESLSLHINDLYRIRQKANKPILYSFKSPIDSNDYILDPLGFRENSDLLYRRVKAGNNRLKDKLSKRLLIWAKGYKDINQHKLYTLLDNTDCFDCIDIVSDKLLLDTLVSKYPNKEYNLINPNLVYTEDYSDIILLSDLGFEKFAKKECNLYFTHNSIFKTKNIESPIGLLNSNHIMLSQENKKTALAFVFIKSVKRNPIASYNLIKKTIDYKNNIG
ncbi:glycosyltransferase family 4 protein [Escherichia coli]|uniref:Glycosyltransferase n=3 Tax=Escherichia TaxID=561 RepID=A0A7H9KCA5_9ESCH|nr:MULTISPECIES: glycosyltransferase [Escherichia]API48891.1 hypothetical protein BSZ13_20375 [Escherichia coli]EFK23747.1 glycosyltransferase, group 1 family protein [Escherichia coli MS 187-1]EGK9460240.1 glycosyltransferase family 4 protein [Escherichia coli]EHT5261784.1 glycosyltransferase [Escherichia coli]EIS5139219.1 glycosyltransferase [Escherichia coli]